MVKLFARMLKLFAVLFIMLELLHNYFDNQIKLFLDPNLVKFLKCLKFS